MGVGSRRKRDGYGDHEAGWGGGGGVVGRGRSRLFGLDEAEAVRGASSIVSAQYANAHGCRHDRSMALRSLLIAAV